MRGDAARVVAAVDIGASSGRVIAGLLSGQRVDLDVVHRFPNGVAERDGHLRWDLDRLFGEVLGGFGALVARYPQVESIGFDTWAVDYGCLDRRGNLLGPPIAYRDARTTPDVIDAVHRAVPAAELYAINGLQFLPFNTVYQLAAEQRTPQWDQIDRIALLPDLLAYFLTGELRTEYTNASTTGLADVRRRTWSAPLLDRLGIPASMLPPIEHPGAIRGMVTPERCTQLGLGAPIPVIAVGTHDTASAFVGVPAASPAAAFIASGTWSLVGMELSEPIVTDAARLANFTNEGGVDGTTRFLRNVGGLWLLQECMRSWAEAGSPYAVADLVAGASALAGGGALVDVDDPALIAPGAMPERIAAGVVRAGGVASGDPYATTRTILDSLAAAYARTIAQAEALAGRAVDVVHVVGGGAQNTLLCQLTANATGRAVLAGPVEATALGNVLVQARALGAAPATLAGLHAASLAASHVVRYQPA